MSSLSSKSRYSGSASGSRVVSYSADDEGESKRRDSKAKSTASQAEPKVYSSFGSKPSTPQRTSLSSGSKPKPRTPSLIPTDSAGRDTTADAKKSVSLSKSRYNPAKTASPFSTTASGASTKDSTPFASAYKQGRLPCRLLHGSVRQTLGWTEGLPMSLDMNEYQQLIVTCASGLLETSHPYTALSRLMMHDLLDSTKVHDISSKLTSQSDTVLIAMCASLRSALMSKSGDVNAAALTVLCDLSTAIGPTLNTHLPSLLTQISKKSFDQKHAETVLSVMNQLAQNGGTDAVKLIKRTMPTFEPVD